MERYLALIVDDEPDILELLSLTLERMDIDSRSAADISTAKGLLANESFDLCLTDMRLPDGDGIDLVRHINESCPNTPVAVITAHGNMELAVAALKAGAFDFVSKPVNLGVLRQLVSTALKLSSKTVQAKSGTTDSQAQQDNPLLGNSTVMQRLRATINKLARSQAPVYISGESGSGKEIVARLIHALGPRADKPFVPVNCGAIPPELMESEFFGHKKGSFTGAVTDKAGLFQAADGGTLFLDEVAELPLPMQVKLLRAIQEKSVRPVGEQKEQPVDVRILSATHKDLATLVSNGQFRQDLFYRINVIELAVPPLRKRGEDIPLLAEHILGRLAGPQHPRLSPQALKAIQGYAFPGNVRELENILERAMTLCEGDRIEADDLQLPEHDGNNDIEDELAAEAHPGDKTGMPLEDYLDTIEKDAIIKALEKTRYNKTAAAKALGITFRALRYRLKKLGLE